MGGSSRCALDGLNKEAWTSDEDKVLANYVKVHGEGKWSHVAKKTDLKRCGKSCWLRWKNYLKPDIKRGNISHDEEEMIIRLHKLLGDRWSLIAGRLPGRTDNEIKDYWHSTLAKRAKDFKMKVFPPIGNVNEDPQTICKAIKLKSEAALVDAAAQLDKKQWGTTYPENYISRKTEYEFKNASQSCLPKLKDHENATDFLRDFNVDDVCKLLDMDIDQTKDDKVCLNGGGGDDGDGESPFLKKLAEAGQESSLDFQSLASSFLESAEEWPPIYPNILVFNQEE